jgi:hypothetical protein
MVSNDNRPAGRTPSLFARILRVNTGQPLNIRHKGFLKHLRSTFDPEGKKFTGEVTGSTLSLEAVFVKMKPYHLAPDVSYANKIAALAMLRDGRAKERVKRKEDEDTREDYLQCWQLLNDLSDDGDYLYPETLREIFGEDNGPRGRVSFNEKLQLVNTGEPLNIPYGCFVEHLRGTFDKDGFKFTGQATAPSLSLRVLFTKMKPYHLAPDVSYDYKITALQSLCDGRAKERVRFSYFESTEEDYLNCWKRLDSLVGGDFYHAEALRKSIAADGPADESRAELAAYVARVLIDTGKVARVRPRIEHELWMTAWRHVYAHAEQQFEQFMCCPQHWPVWLTTYRMVPELFFEDNPRSKLDDFRVYLDQLANAERSRANKVRRLLYHLQLLSWF